MKYVIILIAAPTKRLPNISSSWKIKKLGSSHTLFVPTIFHSQQQIENYQDKLIQMLENYFKTK